MRAESVYLKGAYFGELMVTDIRTYSYTEDAVMW